jgi:CMD domain protein
VAADNVVDEDRRAPGQSVIEQVLGGAPHVALAEALATRASLMQASQANYDAVLTPHDPGGISHQERFALACRIARLNADERLAAHYAGMLTSALPTMTDPAQHGGSDTRTAAILRHVHLVTLTPRDATPQDIAALQEAGVAVADIVRLSQLIAFVSYQVRLIAGLRLLEGTP